MVKNGDMDIEVVRERRWGGSCWGRC